jgi:hypothetical protein
MAIAGVALAFLTLPAAERNKPDFSGTWMLNLAGSDFGVLPAPQRRVAVIEHQEPALRATMKQTANSVESVSELRYTTDGKECRNSSAFGELRTTVAWEGSALLLHTTGKARDGSEFRMDDRWALSADGRQLKMERSLSNSLGETHQRLVFEKR